MVDTQENDPDGIPRPRKLSAAAMFSQSTNTIWSTGPAGGAETYKYDGAGNIKQIGKSWFTYDKVSRLTQGSVNLGALGTAALQNAQGYSFDAYGNIQSISTTPSGQATTTVLTPTEPRTNRLTAATYDQAGNMTSWNQNTYTWDAFDQLARYKTAAGLEWTYLYNASDERIGIYKTGGDDARWTLRGLGNEVLREYNATGNAWTILNDYIYRGSQLLASQTPAGPQHFHLDHLGTPRGVTNSAGTRVGFHVYCPFGEEATSLQEGQRMKFTGHERDLGDAAGAGDDLDYMHARFCAPVTGRFLSIDSGDPKLRLPQSWNRFAYTYGNPQNPIDPDGNVPAAVAAAWPAVEGALTVYDVVDTVKVVSNPNNSGTRKAVAVGLTLTGMAVAGGGYAKLGDNVASTLTQLGQNYARGKQFETAALAALGAAPNTTKLTTTLGATIPDTLKLGITEIKSGASISNTL